MVRSRQVERTVMSSVRRIPTQATAVARFQPYLRSMAVNMPRRLSAIICMRSALKNRLSIVNRTTPVPTSIRKTLSAAVASTLVSSCARTRQNSVRLTAPAAAQVMGSVRWDQFPLPGRGAVSVYSRQDSCTLSNVYRHGAYSRRFCDNPERVICQPLILGEFQVARELSERPSAVKYWQAPYSIRKRSERVIRRGGWRSARRRRRRR